MYKQIDSSVVTDQTRNSGSFDQKTETKKLTTVAVTYLQVVLRICLRNEAQLQKL